MTGELTGLMDAAHVVHRMVVARIAAGNTPTDLDPILRHAPIPGSTGVPICLDGEDGPFPCRKYQDLVIKYFPEEHRGMIEVFSGRKKAP